MDKNLLKLVLKKLNRKTKETGINVFISFLESIKNDRTLMRYVEDSVQELKLETPRTSRSPGRSGICAGNEYYM